MRVEIVILLIVVSLLPSFVKLLEKNNMYQGTTVYSTDKLK